MLETLKFTIEALVPLMCHNGQLADPGNPFSQAIKGITKKRDKTEDDYRRMAELEWEGGLYLDEQRRPFIPGSNIEGMFVEAGRKSRKGETFKAALLSHGEWLIRHDGPKDFEKLKADPRFRDRRTAVMPKSGNRVMRTRPIFVNWSLDFEVTFQTELLDADDVRKTLVTAGRFVGLGDYIPKYGRFRVAGAE